MFDDVKKYFLIINIISIITLNSYELKRILRNKSTSPSHSTSTLLGQIEGARDFSRIFYDLISLNIISLLTNIIPKYGLIVKTYRKIKDKVKRLRYGKNYEK